MRDSIYRVVGVLLLLLVLHGDAVALWINSVDVIPEPVLENDIITFDIAGRASAGPSWVEYDQFTQNGTSLQLDLYVDTGFFGVISDWTYSKQIQPLPAGIYNLEVRAFGYESGMLWETYSVDFTVVPEPVVDAEIDIYPAILNLSSKGKWISCYIRLPEDYNVSDIEPNSVVLENEPNAIEAEWIWFEEDGEEEFAMAKFSRSEVQSILEVGEVELTVSGELADGTRFEGMDTIKVIDKGRKKK